LPCENRRGGEGDENPGAERETWGSGLFIHGQF